MKRIFTAMRAIGVLVLFGAAGASDSGRLSLGAATVLVAVGCALVFFGYSAQWMPRLRGAALRTARRYERAESEPRRHRAA